MSVHDFEFMITMLSVLFSIFVAWDMDCNDRAMNALRDYVEKLDKEDGDEPSDRSKKRSSS